MRAGVQRPVRRNFNGSSHPQQSHITDGQKTVFMAMTSGEPNFCLTSIYVNGKPGVAIVFVSHGDKPDTLDMVPCFVSITPGMKLRSVDGHELEMREGA